MKNRTTPTADRNGSPSPDEHSSQAQGISEAIKSEAAAYTNAVEHWIAEHPAASLAIALGVGVTLGWLVKRT